jgi:hypothetical protein
MGESVWAVPDGLPSGRLIVPDPKYAGEIPVTEPVLWISDEPVVPGAGPLFARMLAARDVTGLWPLLLTAQVIPNFGSGMRSEVRDIILRSNPPGRPWFNGELSPVSAEAIDELNAEELLEHGWNLSTGQGGQGTDFGPDAMPSVPFTSWPGLAHPMPPGTDPDATAERIATSPDGLRRLTGRVDPDAAHLGLVPALDGAAAIATCGWWSNAGDPLEIAVVVRSWQRRFGARLCSLGFGLLCLSVAWPPATAEQARRVAAEHLAFCPDIVGFSTFGEYADSLRSASTWQFWWD